MRQPARHDGLLPRLLAATWCAVMLAACGVADPPAVRGDRRSAPSPAPATAEEVLGEVRLPEEVRSPEVQRLDDGTPVWVVDLGSGDVSVLAATVLDETTDPRLGRFRGLRTALIWDIRDEQFLDGGRWDVHGRAITAEGQPLPAGRLDTYRVRVRDDRTVRVGALVPGEPRASEDPASEEPSTGVVRDPATLRFVLDGMDAPLTVDRALAQSDGSVVVVDADVVRNGTAPVVICATDRSRPMSHEIARCPDGAPRPPDLTVPVPDARSFDIVYGPLLVRVADGTFTDVAQIGASGSAGGGGSDESLTFPERSRVTVADGSVAVIDGWEIVEVRGSDVCPVLSQPRTLYVVRGRVEPCDRPLPPDLPGAVVRAVEDDPETAARLRGGVPVPLYGTPGRARDDVTAWLHPDVFTYDYVVTDLRMLVSIADDPHPPTDDPYSHLGNEAVLRSLRPE